MAQILAAGTSLVPRFHPIPRLGLPDDSLQLARQTCFIAFVVLCPLAGLLQKEKTLSARGHYYGNGV